jgi:hypothetical protein
MTFAELRDDTHGDKSKKANEEAEESEKEVWVPRGWELCSLFGV